ncbi:MAG: metal-dependent hydrolase [Candidatus Acidiferrales bacterium]
MDPITHGITGALIGKAYFSKPQAEVKGRVAIVSTVLGAVFPDIDFVAYVFSPDPLAIVKYHRGFTHSFLGLPVFAIALAFLTRWYARRRGIESPSWPLLVMIYSVGIASHILLDAATSYGTRLWNPISSRRVAWDLVFIIDFTFTAIVLLPQAVAWICREPAFARARASRMWIVFSLCAVGVWGLAAWAGFPFSASVVLAIILILAACGFYPVISGRGFGISRASWCRAGIYAALIYIFACGVAHHRAVPRVESFAKAHGLTQERLAAMPLPPSIFNWSGLIRTSNGVYVSRFDLRDAAPPAFQYVADSPRDRYVGDAFKLPDVRVYWWFARFPVVRTMAIADKHIIEFGDMRFRIRRGANPIPFTLRLVFDSNGKLLNEQWLRVIGFLQRSERPDDEKESAPDEGSRLQ